MNPLLPLFPLELVAFPGEKLNLHIFEPRYKQLINECREQGSTFGIPAYIDGKVMDIGTEMKLLSVHKTYDNGEMDIKTEGLGIFKINEFFRQVPDKLYAGGITEPLEYQTQGDIVASRAILKLMEQLFELLRIDKPLPESPEALLTYEVAHQVGFTTEQEYELLCMKEEKSRQEFMRSHLEQLLPKVEEMERVRKQVQMNGHFKNMTPPQI